MCVRLDLLKACQPKYTTRSFSRLFRHEDYQCTADTNDGRVDEDADKHT